MRLLTLAFALFGISMISLAQPRTKISYYCSYYGDDAVLSSLQICLSMNQLPGLMKHDKAQSTLDRIMAETGLPVNFVLVECEGYKNCSAVNLEGLKGSLRYILYGSKFLDEMDSTSKTYWSSISIFAHEIGHHLSGHTLETIGSRPDKELEADRFSGFIMFKLGATLEQAQAAMVAIGDVDYVSTHPPLANRLAAIRNGWNDGWQANYRNSQLPAQLPTLKNFDEIAADLLDKAYLENILGDHEKAILYSNTAIGLRKNYAAAYVQRGYAEATLALTFKAIKTLDSALAIDPTMVIAKVYKGRAWNIGMMYKFADSIFRQVAITNPGFAALYAERGMMRNNQKRYDEAIKDANKAIILEYKDIYIPYATLGYAYYQKKNYLSAYRNFDLSLRYNRIYPFAAQMINLVMEKLTPAKKFLLGIAN